MSESVIAGKVPEAGSKPVVVYTRWRYFVEVILFATYALFGTTWAAAGTFLKDIMSELNLTISQASFINTSVSIAKVFGPLIAGILVARLGLKRAFLTASILISMGVLAPFAPNFMQVLIARFAMGLGGALVVVYFTPLVMSWFPENERVAVNGLNSVSISFGMTFGFLFTERLTAFHDGSWQMTLLLYSSISITLTLAWWIFGGSGPGSQALEKKGASQKVSSGKALAGYLEALKDKNTWKLILAYSGTLCHYLVLITYFPLFYRQEMGFPAGSAVSHAPAYTMFASIPAVLIGAWLSNRSGKRIPTLLLAALIQLPSALGMFLFKDPTLIIISAVLTGFGMFLWRSPFFTIPQELPNITVEKSGYMMSVFWAISYSISTLCVWGVGLMAEHKGSFIPGFLLATIAASSMFIGSFILPETGNGSNNNGKK
ncbi:MAG: MFS transporter [Firmicutes bacterium]|nr:MFS transporter [Bacillota bacterium]